LKVESIQNLADELDVEILAKVVFTFTPDVILSPLALPRELLNKKVNQIISSVNSPALRDVLEQLKNRPTIQEQWPDEYESAMVKGKTRVLEIENVRRDSYTLDHILQKDREIYDWWNSIRSDKD
jgi:hypothetical protein